MMIAIINMFLSYNALKRVISTMNCILKIAMLYTSFT